MNPFFLSVAAAAALAVSAGSAAAQYNTVTPAPAPAPVASAPVTSAPAQYAPAPYAAAPYGYAPGPMMGGYDGCAGGGCGHFGYVHGKLSGHGGSKFLGGGLGIFTNHGHLFGEDKGGAGAGIVAGMFSGLNGGGQIQPVDPRSGNAGQIVFPHHPFYRGPRDYFMLEDR